MGFTQAIENEHLSIPDCKVGLVNPPTELGFKPAQAEKRCDNVEKYRLGKSKMPQTNP